MSTDQILVSKSEKSITKNDPPILKPPEETDKRKKFRLTILAAALFFILVLLTGISLYVIHLMVSGQYLENTAITIITVTLSSSLTTIIGIIAGTSID